MTFTREWYRDFRKEQERAERRAEYGRLRHQILLKARSKGKHTKKEWAALVEAVGNVCVRCGISAELLHGKQLCKDHALPPMHGGGDSIANLQPMCRNCNSSKGNWPKDFIPFYLRSELGHYQRLEVTFHGWKAVA
jgi:5-methylcytosine-specific restriction endonuclease McrA